MSLLKSTLKSVVLTLTGLAVFLVVTPAAADAENDKEFGEKMLGKGKSHSHVVELQELLEAHGYIEDSVQEGVFDQATYEAVTAFQQESGIFVDGLAGPQTIGALSILQKGDEGETVLALQEDLHRLGYYRAAIDGIFGPLTHQAVKDFQAAENILADGLAGPQTYGALHLAAQAHTVTGESEQNKENSKEEKTEPVKTDENKEAGIDENGNKDDEVNESSDQAEEPVSAMDDAAESEDTAEETISSASEEASEEETTEEHTEEAADNNADQGSEESPDDTAASAEAEENSEEESQETEADESSDSSSNASADSQSESSGSTEGTVLTVEATAYTAYCNGCSGMTYTGLDLRNNPDKKVIAVDPNIIPLGSKVYVEGYGTAVAGDIGGAIKGHKIDLFMPDRTDAIQFGRRTLEITVLD
ncbi:peptidoglycan-binding protein [Salipaludibacillus aurantiacus]|uniref:3D (Asp-Asp-Asp) domain-containing protein n=1 Tax=Salipaludibacillus aurantiacus TaxID=1601833 RepID=A0A1H9WG64_9BACI|nr:peptidoglycan-binding protein [Salipaludibacillus aurantiacus]SES32687.1 3D (Asp-Asp-Asp) domain-containing protein [Salipaludibacillus aurantiacus]